MEVLKDNLKDVIYEVRGVNVILDKDIAQLYGVPTGALNQAVKRNADRFPPDFMFQLTPEEWLVLKSQIVIAKNGRGGSRSIPTAFTEHGVLMLASVLKSKTAASVSIYIARTFAEMRYQIAVNAHLSSDIAILKMKMEMLENEMEHNLGAFNDLSEDMRGEIDNIYQAIAALSIQGHDGTRQTKSQRIGFKTAANSTP